MSLPTLPPAGLEVGTARRHAEAIHALLPQTQCTRCGFQGCRPYAEAIAAGDAEINRCPPGGFDTLLRLAALTGRPVQPLDPACGREGPELVAHIDEERCIGCARCLPPCPVDAIVGGPNLMHMVVTEECTGCELCLPPCPTDCIEIVEAPALPPPFARAPQSLARYRAHQTRLSRWQAEDDAARQRKKAANPLAAALARARGGTP